MSTRRRTTIVSGLALLLAACPSPPGERLADRDDPAGLAGRPFVRVLGTVQDGGLPHAGCSCNTCELARSSPSRRRYVASLAIVLPATGEIYLVDATPDLPEQIERLADVRTFEPGGVDRSPVAGIFLTHAHMGHYLGLAHLGYEVMHSRGVAVHATSAMTAYLRNNGPWSQLVQFGNIELREMQPGQPVDLGAGVSVTPIAVPHRDEFSDTVGFRVDGPETSLFYVPDTDSWGAWSPPIAAALEGVDVALVDATFYSQDELPGRDLSEIGHPLITQTIETLGALVDSGALEVYFTHLNHSNPALDEGSPADAAIRSRAGFAVLLDGQEFPL